jgi:hypothetical protein
MKTAVLKSVKLQSANLPTENELKERLSVLLHAALKSDTFATMEAIQMALRQAARELRADCKQCSRALLAVIWALRVAKGALQARRSRLFRPVLKAA